MPGYNGKNYSLSYALENIGDYFWRMYRDDLHEYAKDLSRKDIVERIHQEWNSQTGCKKSGTDIRIEWAVQIFNNGDWDRSLTTPVPDHKTVNSNECVTDPRRKYAAEYRCDNGMYVRSISELCIANWLYANDYVFDYERAVVFGNVTAHCDFYLPKQDVYIEFWGMTGDSQYVRYKQWKEPLYAKYGYKLLSLYPNDLKNLRDQILIKLNQLK